MNTLKKMAPYTLLCAVAFNILPLFVNSTGGFMLNLLVLFPSLCFLSSLLYGLKQGWNLLYPIMIGILFIPTISLFYNRTAWVYCLGYSLLSLLGLYLGKSIKVHKDRKTHS